MRGRGAARGSRGVRGGLLLKAPPARPPDFDAFWSETRAELEEVHHDVSRETFRTRAGALFFEWLAFDSLSGARIHGYALRWGDDAKRPLVVHGHGYGGGFEHKWGWAWRGVNVLGVEVRGYGSSKEALSSLSPYGYVLTGIESPEGHALRGAVCDYARAAEVGAELFGSQTSRTVFQGASFAGGLAVMAEAVLGGADLLAVAVPSLGWVEARRYTARGGSGAEIRRYLEDHPGREGDLLEVLSYFDPVYFAPSVRCPALVGVGLADEVVPAPTVYAVAERLAGPHEVVTWPTSHADLPEDDFFEERFQAYWLRLATRGIPASFGSGPRSP